MAKSIANLAIELSLESIKFSSKITALSTSLSTIGSTLTGTLTPAFGAVSAAGGMVIDTVTGIGKGLVDVGMNAASTAVQFLELKTSLIDMLNVGVEFEKQMSRVGALTQVGKGSGAFAGMLETARRLGRDTEFTAGQAAGAMSNLALSGFKPDEIQKSIDAVVQLASVGQIEIPEAARIAANALRGFNLPAEQMGHVTDVLAVALSNANTDMIELGHALKYVAPIASAAGKSLEETTAAVMILSDKGLTGSMAGTALRGILMKSANRTEEAKKSMEDLGMTFEDVATGKLKPIADIIDELSTKLGRFGEAKQLEILGNVFEMRAGTGAAALMSAIRDSGSALRDRQKMLENSTGTAARMAAQQLDNVWGAIKIVQSSWEGLIESVYAGFQGPLKQGIDVLTEVFNRLRNGVAGAQADIAGATAGLRPIADAARNTFNDIVFQSQGMWRQVWDAGVASATAASNAVGNAWKSLSGQLPTLQQFRDTVTEVASTVEYLAGNTDQLWEGITLGGKLAWETIKTEAEFTLSTRLPALAEAGGKAAGDLFGQAFVEQWSVQLVAGIPKITELNNNLLFGSIRGVSKGLDEQGLGGAFFGLTALGDMLPSSPIAEALVPTDKLSEAQQKAKDSHRKWLDDMKAMQQEFFANKDLDKKLFPELGYVTQGLLGGPGLKMSGGLTENYLKNVQLGLLNSMGLGMSGGVHHALAGAAGTNKPAPVEIVNDKWAAGMQQGSREAIAAEMRFFAGQQAKPAKVAEEQLKEAKKGNTIAEQIRDSIRNGIKGTPPIAFIKK
jgi:TP901 family phage tail tape measure protein